MVTIQQVEELRKYADVSFNEAKEVLEETNGDILEAILKLEQNGRIHAPENGGFYSSKDSGTNNSASGSKENPETEFYNESGTSFADILRKIRLFIRKMLHKGNRNNFEVIKGDTKVMSIPVTILGILVIFTFWVTIPVLVVGLFFGYRYRFSGPELGRENVNRAMDSVSDAAENIKKEFKGDNTNV